jgi:hypothetical protein
VWPGVCVSALRWTHFLLFPPPLPSAILLCTHAVHTVHAVALPANGLRCWTSWKLCWRVLSTSAAGQEMLSCALSLPAWSGVSALMWISEQIVTSLAERMDKQTSYVTSLHGSGMLFCHHTPLQRRPGARLCMIHAICAVRCSCEDLRPLV